MTICIIGFSQGSSEVELRTENPGVGGSIPPPGTREIGKKVKVGFEEYSEDEGAHRPE